MSQPITRRIVGIGEAIIPLDHYGKSKIGVQVNNPGGSTFSVSQAIVPNDRAPAPDDFMPYPPSVADLTGVTDAIVQVNYFSPVTHIKVAVTAGAGQTEIVIFQEGR